MSAHARGNAGFKDLRIEDGKGKSIEVRIYRMDCESAQDWLFKVAAMVAQAGVPLPSGVPTSLQDIGQMVMSAMSAGRIFRMPGLTPQHMKDLVSDLWQFVHFVVSHEGGTPQMLPASDLQTRKAQIREVTTLLKIEAETVGYSFGFFDEEKGLDSALGELNSLSQSSQTSAL